MRNLMIIGMLGVAAFMAGWFKVNRDGDSTTIEINRAEIRHDARRAIDKGREVLDRREQQRMAGMSDPSDEQSYPLEQEYAQPQYPQPQYPQPQYPQPQYQQPAYQSYGEPASYRQPAYPAPTR